MSIYVTVGMEIGLSLKNESHEMPWGISEKERLSRGQSQKEYPDFTIEFLVVARRYNETHAMFGIVSYCRSSDAPG